MQKLSSQLYLSRRNRLYIGVLPEGLKVSQGSPGLVVALSGSLIVDSLEGDPVTECQSLVVPAASKLHIDTADNIVAVYFFDYTGEDYFSHRPLMERKIEPKRGSSFFVSHVKENELQVLFKDFYQNKPQSKEAFDRFYSWESNCIEERLQHDARVKQTMDLILSGKALEWPLEQIASKVGLSVPRLTQLFRKETGINIRRFKLWQRVYLTSLHCARGMALTDAAVKAGFCDYAHFSNTFTEMTGVNPSIVLSPKYDVYISTDMDLEAATVGSN